MEKITKLINDYEKAYQAVDALNEIQEIYCNHPSLGVFHEEIKVEFNDKYKIIEKKVIQLLKMDNPTEEDIGILISDVQYYESIINDISNFKEPDYSGAFGCEKTDSKRKLISNRDEVLKKIKSYTIL